MILLPEIITSQNPLDTLIKDIVDLVAVLLLPFGIWIYHQVTKLSIEQLNVQHELKGVDGNNGVKGRVVEAHKRINSAEKMIIALSKRMTAIQEQYPIQFDSHDDDEDLK